MSKDAGDHVQLVADSDLDRYVIHQAMRLEFGEDALLRTTSFVEGNNLARTHSLIGEDDFESDWCISFCVYVKWRRSVRIDFGFVSVFIGIRYSGDAKTK